MSSMRQALGRLTPVELREYWEREDTEFTPWLAQVENLELLGEAIGKELEPHGEEVNVGPFRADLLCKDTVTGDLVLIENQIERTDHTHLGQILTYAAGLGAKTIVWVARQFQEEHRAALDWLNEFTHDDIEFYGVQVELWRIGDSPPAPRFDVVAKPNDWSREVRESSRATGPLSETQQKFVDFWRSFGGYLDRAGSTRGHPTLKPHPFWNWGVGRTDFGLCLSLHPKDRRVSVFIVLQGKNAKPRFQALVLQRDAIERELNLRVTWDEKPGRVESQIWVEHPCDFERPDAWDAVHAWAVDVLDRFDRAFRGRVRALQDATGDA